MPKSAGWSFVFASGVIALSGTALAAPSGNPSLLMMPDSSNNRIVLFNRDNGSVVDADYFPLQGGTPLHAMQVGYEIWVSEQLGDRVSRWSLDGTYIGAIGGGPAGGLDNVRGMSFGSGEILLANDGGGNGAPGPAIVRIAFDGTIAGSVAIGAVSPNPFAILHTGSGYLVASNTANDDIHRLNLQLEPVGTYHNSTQLNFAEQMVPIGGDADILVAGFSSDNLVRLDGNGAVVSTIAASGARGVAVLRNGNILWTNGSGAHVYDVGTQVSTLVHSGSGRFLSLFQYADESIFTDGFDPPPLAH